MELKLFDSELKVMDVLWREGDTPAKRVAEILSQEVGWNRNTTYTLINRCIKKGAVERLEPRFICRALVAKEAVQEAETDELVNKVYDGSIDKLFASLLSRKKLSSEQIQRLRDIVGELE
ncbi:MAG: BlaI/MecI/CopY family transcriptional regulator [Oscillospiraceae bacterium]|nr:BlaI/MecI/CopY family transcriptional regulator [Oscillospiraceae bacterium]